MERSSTDVTIARLTRYLFTAPSWQRSVFIVVLLGLIVDGASIQLGAHGQDQRTVKTWHCYKLNSY